MPCQILNHNIMKRLLSILVIGFIYLVSLQQLYTQPTNNLVGDAVMATPNAAALGKYGDIPVNYYTGVPNISIPICELKEGSLSLPISLSYHASGVKVGELASWVGQGWSLNAGGVVSRSVIGLRDEEPNIGYWAVANTLDPYGPSTFNITGSAWIPAGSCSGQICEVTNGNLDSEPDVFSFNIEGYTGKFYVEPNAVGELEVVTIPKQDIQIELALSTSGNSEIEYFIITTPNGVKYYLGDYGTGEAAVESSSTTDPSLFGTNYNFIRSSWFLKKIETPDALYAIDLDYEIEAYEYKYLRSKTDGRDYVNINNPPGNSSSTDYLINVVKGVRLQSISTTTTTVDFVAGEDREDLSPPLLLPYLNTHDAAKRLSAIEISTGSYCKKFVLDNDHYFEDNSIYATGEVHDKRLRLEGIQEMDCTGAIAIPAFEFEYYGNPDDNYFLPHRLSKAIDHWGFYNGADDNNAVTPEYLNIPPISTVHHTNNGSFLIEYNTQFSIDRETNESFMKWGTLKDIHYPTSGSSNFAFEANDYQKRELEEVVEPMQDLNFPGVCFSSFTVTGNPSPITFESDDIDFLNYFFAPAFLECNSPNPSPQYISLRAFEQGNPTPLAGGICIYNGNAPLPPTGTCNVTPMPYSGVIPPLTGELTDLFPGLQPNVAYIFEVVSLGMSVDFTITKNTLEWVNKKVKVGGLRIAQITSTDPIGGSPIVKSYEYNTNDYANHSSGILYNEPQYMWADTETFPYTVGNVNIPNFYLFFSDFSNVPLSSFEGYHIGYERIVERFPGNGSITRTFFLEDPPPAQAVFPVIPPSQPRIVAGKEKTTATKSENGAALAWSSNTAVDDPYTTGTNQMFKAKKVIISNPLASNGDPLFYNIFFVIDYKVRTRPFRLSSVSRTLDNVTTLTNFEYNSANHLFKTAEYFTNSDGKAFRTEFYYPQDANWATGIEGLAIDKLKDKFMIGIPLRTISKVDGVEVGGSWSEYKNFSGNHPYPHKIHKLTVSPGGGSSWYQSGIISTYIDGYPHKTTMTGWEEETYDFENGLLKQKEYEDWTWSWDYIPGTRLLQKITNIDGQSTSFSYDALMRLNTTTSRNGEVESQHEYTYALDPNSNGENTVLTTTSFSNLPDREGLQKMDGLGRFIQGLGIQYGPEGEDVTLDGAAYDGRGRVTSKIYLPETFSSIKYYPDPLNRVEKNINPDGNYTENVYGSNTNEVPNYAANQLYKKTVFDENGNPTSTYTDKAGRTIAVEDALGQLTTYSYEDNGDVTAVTSPAGTFEYDYDEHHRVVSKSIPGGGTSTFDLYDDRDLLLESTDPNGNQTNNTYNEYGQLLSSTTDGSTVSSTYQFDRLLSQTADVIDPNGGNAGSTNKVYNYDGFGRVSSQVFSNPFGTDSYTFTYNTADEVLTTNRVHQGANPFTLEEEFYYDHRGRLLQIWQGIDGGNKVLMNKNKYSIRDELIGKNLFSRNGGSSFLQHIDYGYNTMGWLTDINDTPLPVIDRLPLNCDMPSGMNEFPYTTTTVDLETLFDIINNGGDVVIGDGDPCGPCTNCPEDCTEDPPVCNGAPNCTEQEQLQQQYEVQVLYEELEANNGNLFTINLPTNLNYVQLCDGSMVYLTDEEKASLTGEVAVVDIIYMDYEQTFRVVCDGKSEFVGVAQLLEMRASCTEFLVEGPNCEITVEETQSTCTYDIELDNFQYSMLENSRTVQADFESVVYEDCGNGQQVHESNNATELFEVTIYTSYGLGTSEERLQNGGYIQSLLLHTVNPSTTIVVDLDPSTVLSTYPSLSGTGFDPNDLYFDNQAPANMATAMKVVIDEAIEDWKSQNGVSQVVKKYEVGVQYSGSVQVIFWVHHITDAAYVGIDPAKSEIFFYPNPPTVGRQSKQALMLHYGIDLSFHESAMTPCGNVDIIYLDEDIVNVSASDWHTIILNNPNAEPAPLGGTGRETYEYENEVSCTLTTYDYDLECGPVIEVCEGTCCTSCSEDPNDCPPEVLAQQQSDLAAFQAYVQQTNGNNIQAPTNLNTLKLCDGTEIQLFDEEMSMMSGDYLKTGTVVIENNQQTFNIITEQGIIAANLSGLIVERGENANNEIEFEDPNIEDCDPTPPDCSPEETAQQAEEVALINQLMSEVDPHNLTLPTTLYQIVLCDGTTMYVLEEFLVHLTTSYNVIQIITITQWEQVFTVTVYPENDLFGMHLDYYNGEEELQAEPYKNGNVSWTKWKVANRAVQYYGFQYDVLDRIENAYYEARYLKEEVESSGAPYVSIQKIHQNRYNAFNFTYDGAGNIQSLSRNGFMDCSPGMMDELTYLYNGNRLETVTEQSNTQFGFQNSSSYTYDGAGNLKTDTGKGINTPIDYSYLNLPKQITNNEGTLKFWYDAAGEKLKKEASGSSNYNKKYVNGVEYRDDVLESIFIGDGRIIKEKVINSETGLPEERYRYEFTLTDHLGNARISFSDLDDSNYITLADDPNTEEETEVMEILQENHYYPFGMNMEGGWIAQTGVENQYQYNGKEINEDFGIDWSDYGARWYDASIGRWNGVDPLAEIYINETPFGYTANNPIKYIDPNGMYYTDEQIKQMRENGEAVDPWGSPFANKVTEGSSVSLSAATGMAEGLINAISSTGGNNASISYNFDRIAQGEICIPCLAVPILEGLGLIAAGALTTVAIVEITEQALDNADDVSIDYDYDIDDDDSEYVTLYRGVGTNTPAMHSLAMMGVAIPLGIEGGHAEPATHNDGDSFSIYTSWTTQKSVAELFAWKGGAGGVVMTKRFKISETIYSPDHYGEGEVLIIGVVRDAEVEIVK